MEELRQWKQIACPGSLILTREKQEWWLKEAPRFPGPGHAGGRAGGPTAAAGEVAGASSGESLPVNHTQRRQAQRSPGTELALEGPRPNNQERRPQGRRTAVHTRVPRTPGCSPG